MRLVSCDRQYSAAIPVHQIVHRCAPDFDSAVDVAIGSSVGFFQDLLVLRAVGPMLVVVPGELVRSSVAISLTGKVTHLRHVLHFIMLSSIGLLPIMFGFLSVTWYQLVGGGTDTHLLVLLALFAVLPVVGCAVLVSYMAYRPSLWAYLLWLGTCFLFPLFLAIWRTA